jgi:hypothetical protein
MSITKICICQTQASRLIREHILTDRQTDRQTADSRQADRQTGRQKVKKTRNHFEMKQF